VKRLQGRRLASIGPPLAAWALGSAFIAAFTSQIVGWSVQTDELQLVRLAISIQENHSLTPYLRGEDVEIYSQLYPLLIAPFYWLLSATAAFDAVHIFNAVAMASAAVPVYILGRELGIPKPAATVVAAASVMTVWMVLATLVFTESVAYPATAWAILAMHRAAAKPSPLRDFLALAAIALAFFARTQLLVLAGLYLMVVLVHGIGYPLLAAEGRNRLAALRRVPWDLVRGHPFLMAGAALGALFLLSGRTDSSVLGSYGDSTTGDLLPPQVFSFTLQHIDYVAVGVGVIPFVAAAGWAIAVGFRPTSKAHHAFAVLMLVVTPALSLQVSSFVLRYSSSEIHDRYVMYLAPLLFLGLALFLYADVRPASFVGAAAAALIFFFLAEESDYVGGAEFFASPAALVHPLLTGRVEQLADFLGSDSLTPTPIVQLVAIATAIALPLALRYLPRIRVVAVVGLGVFAFVVAQSVYAFDKVLDEELFVSGNDWIDERVPDDANVTLVPYGFGGYPPRVWWNAEFWNKRVVFADEYGDVDDFTPFPSGHLLLDERTGALSAVGVPLSLSDYLLMHAKDLRLRPRGEVTREMVTFEDEFELIELERPFFALWSAVGFGQSGVFHDGALISIYGGPGQGTIRQRVTLRLAASEEIDPALPRASQERRYYQIRGSGVRRQGVLGPGEEGAETFDICIPHAQRRLVWLDATGDGFHGADPKKDIEGIEIGVKVESIEVRRAARPSRDGGRTGCARAPAAP
jgi:hypothetical protein